MNKDKIIKEYNNVVRGLLYITIFINLILFIFFILLGPLNYNTNFQKRKGPVLKDYESMININLGVYAASMAVQAIIIFTSKKQDIEPNSLTITFAIYTLKVLGTLGYYYYYSIADSDYIAKEDYIGWATVAGGFLMFCIYFYLTYHSYKVAKKIKRNKKVVDDEQESNSRDIFEKWKINMF